MIKCIYEDGQIESKECFNRLCNFNEPCEEKLDCLSNYCDQLEKKCSYHNICSRAKLFNCNKQQCDELNRKYGEYTYNLILHRCENVAEDVIFREIGIDAGSTDEFGDLRGELERQQEQLHDTYIEMNKKNICDNITHDIRTIGGYCEKLSDSFWCSKYYAKEEDVIIPCIWKNNECTQDKDNYTCNSLSSRAVNLRAQELDRDSKCNIPALDKLDCCPPGTPPGADCKTRSCPDKFNNLDINVNMLLATLGSYGNIPAWAEDLKCDKDNPETNIANLLGVLAAYGGPFLCANNLLTDDGQIPKPGEAGKLSENSHFVAAVCS